ncbi:hypothetical protein [Eoetvoesiella caeni]|uniref:Uncharacterized protein n=1 Tax=Eoetvoesiella caeni TaxID=645616 RepID=A0A366HAU8_9BURK|nr:hypothetical protein [Eoetvoesiella caeni]MCI2809336.1 hypothetical protein [Eoetvoesiella caeni]NYT54477.1 hypothetical protein [Eoetvoesiella caeni]RBP39335.1 hypothetical protein DFR37_105128 [Eoetvoesiella caeni]
MNEIEQERETFEAWASDHYMLQRNVHSDTYISVPTMRAWEVWQAAIALDRQGRGEPVAINDAYDKVDRFLRNNLDDDDYAEYSEALDAASFAPQPAEPVVKESLTAAEPEDDKLNLDRLADYIADNWPDKKYSLEEVCQRLHATWPTAFMPAEPVTWPLVTWWDGAQGPAERLAESLEGYAKIKPGANRDVWAMKAAAKWIRAVLATPQPAEPVKVPSDDELIAFGGEEQFFLFCDEDEFLDIAKSVLSRFGQPAQPAAYKDSTPTLRVGESSFATWFSGYDPAGNGDKQRARDAYAAGRDAGLSVAVEIICEAQEEARQEHMYPGLVATLDECARDVSALKSDAKEPA